MSTFFIGLSFAVLCVVLVLRMIRCLSQHRPLGPAYMATVLGAVALFSSGVLIPFTTLDAFLGGTNILHLLRNLAYTGGLWFLQLAVCQVAGATEHRVKGAAVAMICGVFTVCFFVGQRTGTTERFMSDNVGDPWIWAYGSIYMAGILWLSLNIARVIPRKTPHMLPFRIGGVLMALASIVELINMANGHYFTADSPVSRALYPLFAPLLYGGIAVSALGLIAPMVRDAFRSLRQRWLFARIVSAEEELPHEQRSSVQAFFTSDIEQAIYGLIIRAKDESIANRITLSPTQTTMLQVLERSLQLQHHEIPKEVLPPCHPGSLD
ncbi:hypothetical protein C6401_13860 [Arthrobacter woluwensis]|uniref:hypothetical protein n=1 Tax=Arthrobacter woluwensis TaxID=156980 RepID=UPI000D11EAE7|nr:hypothetical protein [Arthrobacter woluwensis]PSS43129.1 hypothetical protein C6401_13860 [Arthrobacter woluwensis]